MSGQAITKHWEIWVYLAGLIFVGGGVYAGFRTLQSDVADIRSTMTNDAQSRQKELIEFAEIKTKVQNLESRTAEYEKRTTSLEKVTTDLTGDMKYVVRWVERQERQEARKP